MAAGWSAMFTADPTLRHSGQKIAGGVRGDNWSEVRLWDTWPIPKKLRKRPVCSGDFGVVWSTLRIRGAGQCREASASHGRHIPEAKAAVKGERS